MRPLLTYLFLLSSLCTFSQSFEGNVEMENVTFPDGSQLAYVHQVIQDSSGQVWFFNNSDHRFYLYDGDHLKLVEKEAQGFEFSERSRSEFHPGHPTFFIRMDSLLEIDPVGRKVVHVFHDPVDDPRDIAGIGYMIPSGDSVIWATNHIDKAEFHSSLNLYYLLVSKHYGPFQIVDSLKFTWYYDGLLTIKDHLFVKLRDQVVEYSPEGKVKTYTFPKGQDPVMTSIVKDEDNTIWVVYSPEKERDQYGVYFLKEGSEQFERLAPENRLPQEQKHGMVFSDGAYVWHWSSPFRLSRIRVSDGKLEDFTNKIIEQRHNFPFYNSTFLSLFRGQSGEIWITTRAGIVKMILEEDLFVKYHLDENQSDCPDGSCVIRGIAEDQNGRLYLSSHDGIKILDRTTGTLSNLAIDIPPQTQKVHGLCYADGTLFWNEYAIDVQTGASKKLIPGSEYDYLVSCMDPEKKHLWMAVNDNPIKVFHYDVEKEEIELLNDPNTATIFGINSEVRQIHYSPKTQSLFLSVWIAGVLELNKKGEIVNQYSYSKTDQYRDLNSMYGLFDDGESLWMGHGARSGIGRLDLSTREYVAHPYREDSFTGPLKRVFQVLPGDDQQLWMVTEKGTVLLDRTSGQITQFPMFPTLSKMAFHHLPGYAASDGQILIGTPDGYLNAFSPDKLYEKAELDKVYPVAINRFDRFSESGDTLVSKWQDLHQLKEIELRYTDRYFELQYFLPDFRNTSQVLYSHWLEGYDKEWSQPSTAKQLRYENLPPGNYTLHIRGGLTPDYYESSERSLRVIVYRAWYATWWAISLYVLAVIGLFLLIYRRQVRRQLERTEAKRLRELDSMKTRLYTNITHEFRTPLTVIMGMNDSIKGHPLETELIHRNSNNLLRLVNQMLDLSKLESGALQMNWIQADIIPFLNYLAESFHSMAEEQQLQLSFETSEPALIMDFDESKTQHIIYNLLSNAIKFSRPGDQVVLGASKAAGNLVLNIKDTGIGIAEEDLEHIFDRFYQADASATRRGEGTGIGLALTRELVLLMDGQISVKSKLGEGTEFQILLPIRNEATSVAKNFRESSKQKLHHPVVEPKAKGPEHPTLLLIEDNKDVVIYIQSLLQEDYEMVVARNGQEGIDKALELIPDIIISDVMMPEKDGFEVCSALKNDERSSHIPIILLTAKAREEDRLEGLKGGADAYLTKPFNKEELQIRLEKLVELRKALRSRYASTSSWSVKRKEPTLNDQFLKKLTEFVQERLDDPELDVAELCNVANLSNMQVNRKLKALTGKTPSRFIRSIRLHKAMELLQTTDLNVSEIAYDVGFSDPNYFSRSFSVEFGQSPSQVRST